MKRLYQCASQQTALQDRSAELSVKAGQELVWVKSLFWERPRTSLGYTESITSFNLKLFYLMIYFNMCYSYLLCYVCVAFLTTINPRLTSEFTNSFCVFCFLLVSDFIHIRLSSVYHIVDDSINYTISLLIQNSYTRILTGCRTNFLKI